MVQDRISGQNPYQIRIPRWIFDTTNQMFIYSSSFFVKHFFREGEWGETNKQCIKTNCLGGIVFFFLCLSVLVLDKLC